MGAGLAGMAAALAARSEGARVTLIDRGSVGSGTNSALSGGVLSGPTFLYHRDEYEADTVETGRGISRGWLVRLVAREAPEAFRFLSEAGAELEEFPTFYRVRPFKPDTIPGVTLVKKLARKVRSLSDVNVLTGFYVTEVLKSEDRAVGVRGFDRHGGETTLEASAVILATGGAGAVYLKNDNQKTIMGQGYRLAAEAGLSLWDMEFVQFYPLVIAEEHLPSMPLYPPFHHEVKLINGRGEDIRAKYGLASIDEAIMKERDTFSVIIVREEASGPVRMDYRKVDRHKWGMYPLSLFSLLRFDFRKHPFAVSPAAHFCMGGVEVDERGQTALPGLFACGEVGWGLHGANRNGGNALTECVVMGSIAGRQGAQSQYSPSAVGEPHEPLPPPSGEGPKGDAAYKTLKGLRRAIRETAWNHAGVVRDSTGLTQGLKQVQTIEETLGTVVPSTPLERTLREDLVSALFSVKAILTASLHRKESRGSFFRKDFPNEDNINWRKNSCLTYDRASRSFSVTHEAPTMKIVNG